MAQCIPTAIELNILPTIADQFKNIQFYRGCNQTYSSWLNMIFVSDQFNAENISDYEYFILFHELGHIMHKHSINSRNQELEADRFAIAMVVKYQLDISAIDLAIKREVTR